MMRRQGYIAFFNYFLVSCLHEPGGDGEEGRSPGKKFESVSLRSKIDDNNFMTYGNLVPKLRLGEGNPVILVRCA
jgi:hypothetical protein